MTTRRWVLLLSSVAAVSIAVAGLVSRLPAVSVEPFRLAADAPPPPTPGRCAPPDHAFPGTWHVPTPDPEGVLAGLALVLDRADRIWILRCFDSEDAFVASTRNGMGRWLESTLNLTASSPLTDAFARVGLRGSHEFSSAILRMEYRAVRGERPKPGDVAPAVLRTREPGPAENSP